MKRVMTILKINILAIIAFPLLLIATAVKLAAKALEKAITIIGTIFVLLGIAVIFEVVKDLGAWMNALFIIILCLVLGGVFTLIALWILGLISSAIMVAVALVMSLLNGLYELVYSGYAAVYHTCKTDYARISEGKNAFANGLCCFFFTLLRAVNRVIILFVTHALKLLVLCSIAIVIGSLIMSDRYIQGIFGINLFAYLKLFSTFDIIYGSVLYLAAMIGVVIILVSLGLEWGEWGREMELSTSDYEKYVSSIMEQSNCIDDVQASDEKLQEKCDHYMKMLNLHISDFEEFMQTVTPVVNKSDNYILRSRHGEYVTGLQEIVDQLSKYGSEIPSEEFVKLMPKIDTLEELKQSIYKQVKKAAAEQTSTAGNGFFAGCDTIEKLDKRYKALCKTYHPDSEAGDENTFKLMSEEYQKLKNQMGEKVVNG